MIRKLSIALVVMTALAITVGSALAANPHYVGPKTPTYSIDSSTGSLWVNFKAAGYGSGVTVDYSATFSYSITWGCITPPFSNEPSGLKTTNGDAVVTGSLGPTSRTGTLSGPFQLFDGDTGFSCPSHNQHEVLVSASYTNILFTLEGIAPFGPSSVSYPS
jgi:hypothetical protein